MNLKIHIFLFLLLSLENGFAQNKTIDGILSCPVIANHFTASLPNEKVYLHLDKTSYFLDETLWFKAYVVNADSNKLTKASEILHVELLTPEGAVIRTQKHRLHSGQCHGYITLDSALYSGYFEIRAYTKAMLNFDEQNYFSRVFPLFEKPQNKDDIKQGLRTLPRHRTTEYPYKSLNERQEVKKEQNSPYLSITFYPEGGNLVKNLKSNIAFQIKDRYGEIVNTMCYLYTNKNTLLDSFASTHLGMGCFELTPQANQEYYIKVKDDEKDSKHYLPGVFETGHVINIDNLSDSINLKVSIESTRLVDTLGLVILSRGRASSFSVISPHPNDRIHHLYFKRSNLREGVNQAVLYNSKGQELASRMFFVCKPKSADLLYMSISKISSTDSLQACGRQEILFELKDSNNVGLATNFSLSICDSSQSIPTFNTDNIYTNLLLSSELKGFVPNVHYYFESKDIKRKQNLDLLMMVYGWSRCKWEYLSGYKNLDIKYLWEKDLAFYCREYSQKWINTGYFDKSGGGGRIGTIYGERSCMPADDIRIHIDTNKIRLLHIVNDSAIYHKDKHSDIYKDQNIPYFSLFKNKIGHCIMNFEDFYGECKLFLSQDRIVTHFYSSDGIHHSLIITDSEYSPQEKPYGFSETMYKDQNVRSPYTFIDGEYIRQYSLDEAQVNSQNIFCFHPSIKTNCYNKGFYNQLFPMFDAPIFERVNDRPYNSIEDYKKTCNIQKKYLHGGELWSTSLQLYSPSEYLAYYKLPLGSITYIANTMVDTSLHDSVAHFIIPIRLEYPEIREFKLDTSKYTYFIDSTIIHTSNIKRENIHNTFKNHSNYIQYEIKDILKYPSKTFSKEVPDYVIEHFCRIVKRKSLAHTRAAINKKRDVEVDWEKHVIPGFTEIDIIPWHANRERNHRIQIFQGLTRVEKEFYSPDYSKEPLPRQGDRRRTLYWNPNVKTDSLGRANVVFYNNNTCSSYKIDAQGLTECGLLINKSETMK